MSSSPGPRLRKCPALHFEYQLGGSMDSTLSHLEAGARLFNFNIYTKKTRKSKNTPFGCNQNCECYLFLHPAMATPVLQQASNQAVNNRPDADIEARVTLATDAYRSGQYNTIKAAAEAFGAPYHRTRNRCRGRHSRQFNGGNNKVLDEALETALHASLQRLITQGIHISTHIIWRTANDILRLACEDGSEPRHVRQRWARRYLARNRHVGSLNESAPRPSRNVLA
ncbi:hypothetical protein F4782DRAFT_520383 [Xylaria castorea]|nr:hypothetical protein F4782DRAFT_520383 [Xylaria castorea]